MLRWRITRIAPRRWFARLDGRTVSRHGVIFHSWAEAYAYADRRARR